MVEKAEELAADHEIIVQAGHTDYKSDKMKIFDFISAEKLKNLYEKADYIITHGGAGSMFQAVKAGKKIIVFPRLQKYGEHVDDHQLQLSCKLENLGYLLVFRDGDEMSDVFNNLRDFKPKSYELKGNIPLLVDKKLEGILF